MENTILVGKKQMHRGAMIGIISNGGKFQIDNYIIEIAANPSEFRTVQIYQQGLDAKPIKQGWVRTKKGDKEVIIKEKIIIKEPEKPQRELTTITTDEVLVY